MKKITKQFKTHNAKQFVESISEQANSLYYVFAGRHVEWTENGSNDISPPTPSDSEEDTYYQIYRDMVFGKKVNADDVKHMIDNNEWTSGTVYNQYDNTATSLTNFFVVVNESGGKSVFKCLFNNKGAPSISQPTNAATTADDDVYITTADGYQWVLMYFMTDAEYNKFATSSKVPIIANTAVQANAVPGAIDVINVNTGGSRYFSVANGVVKVANVGSDPLMHELESFVSANVTPNNLTGTFVIERADLFGKHANGDINTANNVANGVIVEASATKLRFTDVEGNFFGQQSNVIIKGQTSSATCGIDRIDSTTSSLSSNTDFYKGSVFYITAGTGAGQQRTISEYIVTGSARRVLLALPLSPAIDSTSRFEISPRISVVGDGTGLEARAIVNTSTFAVDTIDIVNRGSGYSYGAVQVFGNTGIVEGTDVDGNPIIGQANNANVSIIIGPKGGHGSDPITELGGSTIGISVDFANNEGGNISINNDFRQFGLLKDPLFANVQLTIDTTTLTDGSSGQGSSYAVNDVIVQSGANNEVANGATGIVKSRASGTLAVANVYGNFIGGSTNTALRIVNAANTSSRIDSVLSNPTRSTSNFDSFDQRLVLTGFANQSSVAFTTDEIIKQESTDATGVIEVINSTSVALTRVQGNWLASDTTSGTLYSFNGQTSAGRGYITGIRQPDLVEGSGEVLYIENGQPITRDAAQTERIKLLIEF
jgi:hypothetical protein